MQGKGKTFVFLLLFLKKNRKKFIIIKKRLKFLHVFTNLPKNLDALKGGINAD